MMVLHTNTKHSLEKKTYYSDDNGRQMLLKLAPNENGRQTNQPR